MAIKTTTFGGVKLSGNDAARFIQHMNEDKPNKYALAAIERSIKTSEKVRKGAYFKLETIINEE